MKWQNTKARPSPKLDSLRQKLEALKLHASELDALKERVLKLVPNG